MIALDATRIVVDLPGQVVELSWSGTVLARHPVVGHVRAVAIVDGRVFACVAEGGVFGWEQDRLVVTALTLGCGGLGAAVVPEVGQAEWTLDPQTGERTDGTGLWGSNGFREVETACGIGPDGEAWCPTEAGARRVRDRAVVTGRLRAVGRAGLVVERGGHLELVDAAGQRIRTLSGREAAVSDDTVATRDGATITLTGAHAGTFRLPSVAPPPILVPPGSILLNQGDWFERLDPATGATTERLPATWTAVVEGGRLVLPTPRLDEGDNALVFEDLDHRWVAAVPGRAGPVVGDVVTVRGADDLLHALDVATGRERWALDLGEDARVVQAGAWLAVATRSNMEWSTVDATGHRGPAHKGALVDCPDARVSLVAADEGDQTWLTDVADGARAPVPRDACGAGRLADGGFVWTVGDRVGVSDAAGLRWSQDGLHMELRVANTSDLVLIGATGLVALDGKTGEPRWTRRDPDGGVRVLITVP